MCGAPVRIAQPPGGYSAAGYRQYRVTAEGSDAIRVSVSVTEPTRLLSLIGVDLFTCAGTAVAAQVTGVMGGP